VGGASYIVQLLITFGHTVVVATSLSGNAHMGHKDLAGGSQDHAKIAKLPFFRPTINK